MISDNLNILRSKITEIARKSGRSADSVRLVAVSKRFPVSAIEEASQAGQIIFGENYIQEAQQKYAALPKTVQLHFIGHLQSNKAKIAAQIFSMIETVDSIKLAKALHLHLSEMNKTLDILIQVNIGNDNNKSGVYPEYCRDLLREIQSLHCVRPLGLMTIPPYTEDAESARPFFQELRLLSESLKKEGLFYNNTAVELSMGMSGDYPVAIEEGATFIRVGTAIFGER
jgi:hypothetical protein